MKKRFLIILIIMIFIIIVAILNIRNIQNAVEQIKIKRYGEPVDYSTGIINNEFFSIEIGEEGDPKKNAEGISEAIKYATKNGIKDLKLQQGKYMINGEGNRGERKGIKLESNINLDLNNSILEHEICDSNRYSIINIDNVENVKIYNGKIIGDKNEHLYGEGTNEWGYGVEIVNSINIEVQNLEIEDLIGDGILVTGKSKKVYISDNVIHDCRRQGISICGVEGIEVINNEVYQISGTNPQSGIDIEGESNYIKDVSIKQNKIHTIKSNNAIISSINVENVEVVDNELHGTVLVCDAKDKITIENNIIKDGSIYAYITKTIYNTNRSVDDMYIVNNVIENGNIFLNSKEKKIINGNIQIYKNTINEGIIEGYSINAEIVENIIKNLKEKEYCFKFEKVDEDEENYKIILKGNNLEGKYNNEIIKEEGIEILDGE